MNKDIIADSEENDFVAGRGTPFQGPKLGSCLTLGNELSEETHVLTKQEILLGKGTRVESSRVREPRRTALPHGLGFMVMGLVSGWSLANHSNSESFLVAHACIAQPRWMLARGILGSGRTRGVSFRPFPSFSDWWWLISSVFLIRISCHKTTHANGYYDTWPGWAVSISVLPLTIWVTKDSERPLGKIGEVLEYFYKIDPLISVFWKPNVKWPVSDLWFKNYLGGDYSLNFIKLQITNFVLYLSW